MKTKKLFAWLFLAVLFLSPVASVMASQPAFAPGEVWRDTAGQPINVHGGGMLYHEGTY